MADTGVSGMNIYHIGWVQDESFALCAVVIAPTEAAALAHVALDAPYNSKIRVSLMGVCTDGTSTTMTVCKESL